MKQKYINCGEICFVTLGVLFFSGGIKDLIPGGFLITVVRWSLLFGSISLILIQFNRLVHKVKRDIWLISLIVLVIFSFSWSDFPDYSLLCIRSEFLAMTLFGIYLGISSDIKSLNRKLSYGLILCLLLSWITAVAVPSIGRTQPGEPFAGTWTGIYGHKNNTSSYMVLTSLVLLLESLQLTRKSWMGVPQHLWIRLLGLSAFAFVFITGSGTGLVLSILMSSSLFLYSRFRWQGKFTVLVLDLLVLIFGLVSSFLLGNWQEIVISMGKDPTLTGRTPMWDVAIQRILERPLLGYGLQGFWAPGSPYPAELGRAVDFTGNFVPPHPHNGFIDVAISVGLVGLCLFLVSLLSTIGRALHQAYSSKSVTDLLPLGFLILFLINNITESYIVYRIQIFWVIYIAIALNVGRSRVQALQAHC
jgi:exopolysaccharide production protein ExoQ